MDDCWAAINREYCPKYDDMILSADHNRFPSGMPYLVKYVHSLELKFGIYGDCGNFTCAGYPGSAGFEDSDAFTFAEWDVDYVKMDG